jgi:predicted O-methyltransferase YrrM
VEREQDESDEVKVWARPGHFYSPIPDTRRLADPRFREHIWPAEPHPMPGVDWHDSAQLELCREFTRQQPLSFPDEPTDDPTEYARSTPIYPALDAWVLQAFLRRLEPKRVIEVGAGNSSLVTARVNREFFDGQIQFTSIDPFPKPFLKQGIPGMSALRVEEVQETPPELFEELRAGDLLFIDTSHAVKTGGDVPWIYNQILPRLNSGVVVHIHDVYLPGDYPERWVAQGRAWNEIYLIQSFLAFNSAFEILLGVRWMVQHHWEALVEAFPELTVHDGERGCSLWIRRV